MVGTERGDGKRSKTENQYRFLAKSHALNSREQNGLCDVIIQVQDVSFYGSRFILGSASPVLKCMFLADMKESQSKTVPLKGVSVEGFQVIWDFLYADRYGTEDEDVALAVLMDSHHLQIDILCEEYTEKLKKMLRPSNAFVFLCVAEKLKLNALQNAALDSIARRFQEIIPTSDFLSMSLETLQMFLERDDLEVSSEVEIYEAVKKWLRHDPSRTTHLPKLLNHVRLPLLPLRYLHQDVLHDPLVSGDPYCLSLVLEAKDFHVPQLRDTVPVEKTRTRGTGFYPHPDTFWCVGRNESGAKVLSLSPRNWSFQVLAYYPWPDDNFKRAFVAIDRKLFVTGLGDTKIFYLAKRAWESGPAPLEHVLWPTSATGLDSIFVCGGGFGEKECKKYSKSVNRFELGSWKWIHGPDMKYERHAASATFLDSSLHIIGGYPNWKKHERLDTRNKTWNELCQWPGELNCPCVTVHNDEIHVAGGGTGCDLKLADVYVYDARKNDWRALPPMKEKRWKHGLISFEGNLYAVGGGKSPSVEVYDRTEWKVVARLDVETCERACFMQWTNGCSW